MTEKRIESVRTSLSLIIRALLVAGKEGAPAEGLIPFNPLYFNILRVLGDKGSARPSDLADALMVPRTTISTALTALAKRKVLKTAKDKDDGRALSVSLTPEGVNVLSAITRQDRRNSAAMLAALDDDEQRVFVAALRKVAESMSQQSTASE